MRQFYVFDLIRVSCVSLLRLVVVVVAVVQLVFAGRCVIARAMTIVRTRDRDHTIYAIVVVLDCVVYSTRICLSARALFVCVAFCGSPREEEQRATDSLL